MTAERLPSAALALAARVVGTPARPSPARHVPADERQSILRGPGMGHGDDSGRCGNARQAGVQVADGGESEFIVNSRPTVGSKSFGISHSADSADRRARARLAPDPRGSRPRG